MIGELLSEKIRFQIHSWLVADFIEAGPAALEGLSGVPEGSVSSVTAAFALRDEDSVRINALLSQKLGKEFRIESKVDEALIAGIVITVGSFVIDGR